MTSWPTVTLFEPAVVLEGTAADEEGEPEAVAIFAVDRVVAAATLVGWTDATAVVSRGAATLVSRGAEVVVSAGAAEVVSTAAAAVGSSGTETGSSIGVGSGTGLVEDVRLLRPYGPSPAGGGAS